VKNLEEYELAKGRIVATIQKAIKDLRQRRIELKDLEYSVQLYFVRNKRLNWRKRYISHTSVPFNSSTLAWK